MADKGILCEPCLYVHLEIEAAGFCLTCAECLCSKCIIDHRKTKVTRNHEVHQDSIPDNIKEIKEMNEMLVCPIHNDMKIAYRCNDHSSCICTVCRVENHRNCEYVLEITKSEASDKDLANVQEKFKDLRLSTALLKDRKFKNKETLCQSRAEILSEQEVIIQKAINTLEELKTKLAKETDEQVQVALSDIDKDIESVEVIEQSVKNNEGIFEAAKKYGNSVSVQVIGNKLADVTLKQQNLVKDLGKKNDHQLLFLKNEDCIQVSSPGTISLNFEEETEIKRECVELCIEKTSDEITECEASNLHAGNTNYVNIATRYLPTTSQSVAIEGQEINVSADTDKNLSSIYGILVLTDGRLLIIDYDNLNIKLLSSVYTLLHVLRLPGKPIRLCSLSENEVAVSFERVRRVNRYSVAGNTILYDGGFPTTLFNHGIGFDGNSIVALMCDEDFGCSNNAKDDTIQVELRNPSNGKINGVIRNFKVEGNKTWSLTLNNTQALKFTEDGHLIIAETNRLLCFSCRKEFGKMIAIEKMFYVCQGEVQHDDIENIAIDSESIFVCTASGSVLQLSSSDFNSHRIIVQNTGHHFKAIAIDSTNGRLILGCDEKDEILVYEVKRNV